MITAYTMAKPEDVVQDSLRRIRGVGLTFTENPPVQPSFHNNFEGMPLLPEDPTLLEDEEIMRYFFAFTEWTSFAEGALWVAQADEGTLEAKVSRARGAALVKATGVRTITEQKQVAATDPEVVCLEDELYAQSCLRKGLETVYRRCERNAAAMSRELSRRGARASTDRRAAKWSA